MAFLAAVAATAAAAIAAGAGVIASGLDSLLGAVVGQRGLVAIGACFVTALAFAAFRPFGAFRTLGALAFGAAVAAHVLAAAFGAFSAVAARFVAAVAVAVGAMALAAAVLAVVAALATAGGAALGGVFLGGGAAAGLALSPLPVSQPTRRLNRPPRPPEAAGAGAAAAGAGAGVDTGAGCEGVMPLTSASGRLLISCSRGCQAASVDGASTSSKLVFLEARVVMTQALDVVMRRFQVLVGDQQQVDLQARFHLGDVRALFVQQIGGHVHRHLACTAAVFSFMASSCSRRRTCRALDSASRITPVPLQRGQVMCEPSFRAGRRLARQFHQAETGDLAHLHAGAVEMQGITQALFDGALVLAVLHVDEVDDDQAAQVAQAQLAGHFVGCFHVGAQRGFLDVGAAGGTRRVDVHGHQRLGVVDDHGAAGRQLHGAE